MKQIVSTFYYICKVGKLHFSQMLPILLLFVGSASALAAEDMKKMLDRLDESLSHKAEYEKVRIDKIETLHSLFNAATDLTLKYSTQRNLFEEYKSFRYDSASVSASRCLEIAIQLDNPDLIAESQCNIAFSLVAAGIPMEANRILGAIDASSLPLAIRKNYYYTCYKLWSEEANRIQNVPISNKYSDRSNAYLDSLIQCIEPNTSEYWNYIGSRHMRKHEYDAALKAFKKFFEFKNLDAHTKAMVYAEVAWAYIWKNEEDKAIENFISSAIYDNESATREITALYLLAEHIANKGESARANRYIHLALDDINFYDARHRKIELGTILPQIEQERYNIMRSQRNTVIIALSLAFLLVLAILASFLLLRRKNRQLTQAEETERKNLEQLENVNQQLIEANNIKTEYVGLSFYANAEAIAKMEKLYKSIERQLTTKQYDKIKESVNPKNLEKERENMYSAFDTSFLGLYPDFVQKYNELFAEEDRRYSDKEGGLTSEMRIFALIRLGINDSERIAKFLDYSVHTVNTYKTRIKNRSIVDNDKFEGMIRMI